MENRIYKVQGLRSRKHDSVIRGGIRKAGTMWNSLALVLMVALRFSWRTGRDLDCNVLNSSAVRMRLPARIHSQSRDSASHAREDVRELFILRLSQVIYADVTFNPFALSGACGLDSTATLARLAVLHDKPANL